jgi:hypothetical protein
MLAGWILPLRIARLRPAALRPGRLEKTFATRISDVSAQA